MPAKSTKDIPRSEPEQVAFAYETLLERLDLVMSDLLETADGYDEESETNTELRVVHARLSEIMSKNSKLRHRLKSRKEKP